MKKENMWLYIEIMVCVRVVEMVVLVDDMFEYTSSIIITIVLDKVLVGRVRLAQTIEEKFFFPFLTDWKTSVNFFFKLL